MDLFVLPPASHSQPLVRKGNRYVLSAIDHRSAGKLFLILPFVLFVVTIVALLQPDRPGEGKSLVIFLLANGVVVLPLTVGGVFLTLRHPTQAILDLAERRLYRDHWRTGLPADSRPTGDLHLFVQNQLNGDGGRTNGRVQISALGPEPSESAPFRVALWTDSAEEPPEKLAQCLAAFQAACPWKGVFGDLHMLTEQGRAAA